MFSRKPNFTQFRIKKYLVLFGTLQFCTAIFILRFISICVTSPDDEELECHNEALFLQNYPRITNDTSVACRLILIPPNALLKQLKQTPSTPKKTKTKNGTISTAKSQYHADVGEMLSERGNCEQQEPSWVTFQKQHAFRVAKVNEDLLGKVVCNFSEIYRVDDYIYLLLQWTSGEEYTLQYSDILAVNCSHLHNAKKWRDVLYSPLDMRLLKKHQTMGKEYLPSTAVGLNVLVWLFDSTTRNNYIRHLPKAWHYMENVMKGTLFRGYNVVGINTLPNVMPLHLGYFNQTWLHTAQRRYAEDSVMGASTLFSRFQKRGYATGYYEDWQFPREHGTFQTWMHMRGFKNPMALHHSRAFFINRGRTAGDTTPLCIGNLSMNRFNQELVKNWWSSYKDVPKYFFYHGSTYTHEDDENLSVIEEEFLDFLHWANSQLQHNTVLVFMSDHGNYRSSPLWPSLQGQLDISLPMLYMVLPESLKQRYPHRVSKLEENAAERLSTPLDLHKTLEHFLDFSANKQAKVGEVTKFGSEVKRWVDPRGLSLFLDTPKKRTCDDAGVDVHFCACLEPQRVKNVQEAKAIEKCTKSALRMINTHLTDELGSLKVNATICQNWELVEVSNAWLLKGPGVTLKEVNRTVVKGHFMKDDSHYSISFVANPGATKFTATIHYNLFFDRCLTKLEQVSRRDRYDRHSFCVDNLAPQLKRWCFCAGQGKALRTAWS